MTQTIPQPQIAILDTGGQYCHLIARKVRELGVYADVLPSDTPADQLRERRGLIISGGPGSVYDPASPTVDSEIFRLDAGILGICYGQQLLAWHLGGEVQRGEKGEYGLAILDRHGDSPLFRGMPNQHQIWMSHRDTVQRAPTGFQVLARTETCSIAAIAEEPRRLYGVQFHPEVVHTQHGIQLLTNFLFDICGCTRDWDPRHRVGLVEEHIREQVGNRNVFFFVSGGVDSTVAYTLCLRALGENRVSGFYVDTGLMREGETAYVRELFRALGSRNFMVEEAGDQFLSALAGVVDPEQKRHIIGEQFVEVQDRILRTGHFLEGNWILGQGTIYPDTIESGGSAKADLIKTHHNRVAGIQKLMEERRIIEPLSWFYKDEVREIGRELGLPSAFLDRHPFPGPGLAIRCLCSDVEARPDRLDEGWLIPVKSVGVQGDSRSHRPVLAISGTELHGRATELTNRLADINRVIGLVEIRQEVGRMSVHRATLTAERLERLRKADAIVRKLSAEASFDQHVWQFPVILIPFGGDEHSDSVVLRPIDSIDGMTAQAMEIPALLLNNMAAELLRIDGIDGVFVDLTHKPPGTIEWE